MLNTFKKIFGTKNSRDLKKLVPIVKQINSLEEEIKKLSDTELQAQTNKFRKMIEGLRVRN